MAMGMAGAEVNLKPIWSWFKDTCLIFVTFLLFFNYCLDYFIYAFFAQELNHNYDNQGSFGLSLFVLYL